MGGYGSGQYQSYDAKDTVEQCTTLNIFKLHQEGIISWGCITRGVFAAGKNRMGYTLRDNVLTLNYHFTTGRHKGREVTYGIRISATTPHFGGQRLWWHCPACNRRAGKLYLAPSQLYYLCRQCADLTYQSTREPTLKKLLAQMGARDRRLSQLCAKYGIESPS